MTYIEAETAAKRGHKIRHPGMSEGWLYEYWPLHDTFYAVNPHTGSRVAFPITEDDRARKDWSASP